MLYASEGMNKLTAVSASDIGQTGAGPNPDPAVHALPGSELATTLRSVCCHGVVIAAGTPQRLPGGATIDLEVVGPRGTIGIVCDALDASKLRSRPEMLSDASVDRVYCVSALDSMDDPRGVAEALATAEPGYFRRSRRSVRTVDVEKVLPDVPGEMGSSQGSRYAAARSAPAWAA